MDSNSAWFERNLRSIGHDVAQLRETVNYASPQEAKIILDKAEHLYKRVKGFIDHAKRFPEFGSYLFWLRDIDKTLEEVLRIAQQRSVPWYKKLWDFVRQYISPLLRVLDFLGIIPLPIPDSNEGYLPPSL